MKDLIEIKEKRKLREKHYLKSDGTFLAEVYNHDVHYLNNGKYEEIDNTLVKEKDYYVNKNNAFQTYFNDKLIKIKKDGYYLSMYLKEMEVKKPKKYKSEIIYENILESVDLKYELLNNKIKEFIILKDKNNIPNKFTFIIDTNLELEHSNQTIKVKNNNEVLFEMDKLYMFDSNNIINNNVYYELKKGNNNYVVDIILDKNWLDKEDTLYPVTIDPTITNKLEANNVYDTYIYPGDTNIDRNSQDILKIGVEKVDNVDITYRTILKFDLPTIGTGSEVINAQMNLTGHSSYIENYLKEKDIIDVHRITENWLETTANWNNINDKFNSRIEEWNETSGGYLEDNNFILGEGIFDITNSVKKWYSGTSNYGVMLKSHKEIYDNNILKASFYSKNHNLSGIDPKPILIITYRNQNGLESYMTYKNQSFTDGASYINNFNGNLTSIFDIGKTINGKFPVSLNIVYNTNDVVLNNNYGYGIGYKLNFHQMIKEVTIEESNLLEYTDEDGTIHYFTHDKEIVHEEEETEVLTSETLYYDEDGLSLTIEKQNNDYVMKDKNNNQYKFIENDDIWYLSEIKDTNNNTVTINYDINNRIYEITDANNSSIELTYNNNQIVVVSPSETVYINYENNKISTIVTPRGTTTFTYNNYNLIEEITDINSKKIKYEYYETIPYKIKKLSEYSILNNLGKYLEFKYEFSATTVIDEKGKYNTYTFNENGNTVSVSNLNSSEDVKNAYGKSNSYFPYGQYINKPILDNSLIKYVNNYLTNTSFEKEDIYFEASQNINMTISNEEAKTGSSSLKLVSNLSNQNIYQEIEVPKGKYYTFSAYIKNNNNLNLGLSYLDSNNQLVEELSSLIESNNEFNRYEVSIYYDEYSTSDLKISLNLETIGTLYLDDIQLEEGEVSNYYNLIDNSNFNNGLEGWTITNQNVVGVDEVITLSNGYKALKIEGDPYVEKTLEKVFDISGKAGDVYNISFWYKNVGIPNLLYDNTKFRKALVSFDYSNEYGTEPILSENLNINDTEWQFFSENFTAEYDYDNVNLVVFDLKTANKLYLTNFSLFKNLENNYYSYDEEGNLVSSTDKSKETNTFNYDKNNQLINMLNPKGSNFDFEYDNLITDRVIKGISSTGISNKIKYDNNANPIITNISNVKQDKEILEKSYYIRAKGTDKYLNKSLDLEANTCSHDIWKITKDNEYYKISSFNNKYLTLKDNTIKLTNYTNDLILFELTKNNNGSYLIKPKNSSNYLTINNNTLILSELIEDNYNQQFYFEDVENNLFIENKAEYTEDGRFITKKIDTLGNETLYDINQTNGLTNSVTDSNGIETSYTYNTKEQITSVTKEDKSVTYEYNNQDLLSKITNENKEYNFLYDEFLNIESININNNTLITNEYEENNGNLLSSTYGNNDEISFAYDDFDRVKTITKMNDTYNYYYDNLGNLSKITSLEDTYNYYYDLAQRISSYKYNNFIINYDYDKNSSVIEKSYKLDSITNIVSTTYNDDNSITKTEFETNDINNLYDELGRVEETNINDIYKTNYKYITNGKKTSLIIQSIKNDDEELSYEYDKLNNITHIYRNNNLTNKYYYDNHNQLIKEDNYLLNKTLRYIYDNSGNILFKREYEIKTDNLLKEDTYEYSNTNWEDQLTKYNNIEITYDNIGNPISIGDIDLIWTNGRELESYTDLTNTINYKYNKDGIRTSKEINETLTEYFTENNNIIFEKINNNVIYYLREVNGNLIGLKYNDSIYYYIKNAQEDIIGILNSSLEQIVSYEYDSWGNTISIKDNNNNEITSPTNIGIINPFRYRSYYFDKETNLYYLNSRYYNPIWGRFLNADGAGGGSKNILSQNLYVYCGNNPINNSDSSGEGWLNNILKNIKKNAKKYVTTVIKSIANIMVPNLIRAVKAVETTTKVVANITNSKISVEFGVNAGIKNTLLYGSVGYGTTQAPGIDRNHITVSGGGSYGLSFPVSPYITLSYEKATQNIEYNRGPNKPSVTCGILIYYSKYPYEPNTITISPSASCDVETGYTWEWDNKNEN